MAKWTVEQAAAIQLKNANLLISAAAGSGKTAVLIERMTQAILSRETSVDDMLVVTYTNAAAGEMRERIERALAQAIEDNPAEQHYLHDQIKRLNRAHIQTFHAFCLNAIRSHFQRLDIDPGFRMMDDAERLILVDSALDLVFEEAYENPSDAFKVLVEGYASNRDDKKLRDMVKHIHAFVLSQVNPNAWLNDQPKAYMDTEHAQRQLWRDALLESFRGLLEYGIEAIDMAITLCEQPQGPLPYLKTLKSDRYALETLLEASHLGLEALEKTVLNIKLERIATIKKNEKEQYDEVLIDAVKGYYRDKVVKKYVLETITQFYTYKSMERYEDELEQQGGPIAMLCELTQAFQSSYTMLKKEKNIMDFSDLEHYAIQVLEDDAVCQKYKDAFHAIFVDEYQDSSGIQEYIIQRISRDANVFMVGDVKQSIYKFRLADPELFLSKYKTFTPLSLYRDHSSVRIDLKHNFRTRPDILNTVNAVFENIMSEALGDVDYDDAARLHSKMPFLATREHYTKVCLLASKESLSDDALDQMTTAEREAMAVAYKIKELIGTPIYFPKTQEVRPCQYKDIVVLMRSSKSWTPIFEQVFTELGVPLYADSRSGYFDALEIRWLVDLLTIIDNPYHDLAFLSVLRSPIVKAPLEAIISLKKHMEGAPFYYDRFLAAVADENPFFTSFHDRLKAWRDQVKYMPLDAFIWNILLETQLFAYVGAMPGGVVRQANLNLLIERAAGFKQSKLYSLAHLIAFLEEMALSGGEMGIAMTLSEEDNVVKLMSIHKSKGLEFPVVMIAGLGRRFNMMDTHGDLIVHKKWGMALSFVNVNQRTKSKTLPQFLMKHAMRIETLSEEMRVLYVGLTRPVDQLVCFASVSDLESKYLEWQREKSVLELVHSSAFIDWIMPAWMHRKDVFIEQVRLDELDVVKDEGIEKEPKAYQDDSLMREEVIRRLAFEPAKTLTPEKPIKISVTDLKKEEDFILPQLIKLPRFEEADARITAVDIGNYVHRVLEKIPLTFEMTLTEIKAFIEGLCDKGILPNVAMTVIDYSKIYAFMTSEMGKALRHAKAIYKETPFVYLENGQLIQGVIDLYFETDSGMILVDYKTDALKGQEPEAVAKKHEQQVHVYGRAIESITGKPVIARYIYLIESGHCVRL